MKELLAYVKERKAHYKERVDYWYSRNDRAQTDYFLGKEMAMHEVEAFIEKDLA